MTARSVPISSDGRDPTMEVDVDDISSIATPTIGYRNTSEDQTFVSKTIRFYFAPHERSEINRIHPIDVHTQWIRLIQKAYGDNIKIINNSNRPVTNLDTSKNASRAFLYAQQFTEHVKPLGNSKKTGEPMFATVIVPYYYTSTIGSTQEAPDCLSVID